jgi:hypothetical protein
MTQADLAATAELSIPTVRLLERGRGNLDSWHAAYRVLGLELAGRSLPGGVSLGARLATLRRRRYRTPGEPGEDRLPVICR